VTVCEVVVVVAKLSKDTNVVSLSMEITYNQYLTSNVQVTFQNRLIADIQKSFDVEIGNIPSLEDEVFLACPSS
jgi:hypothetical protein